MEEKNNWWNVMPYGDQNEEPSGNGSIIFWSYDVPAIIAEAISRRDAELREKIEGMKAGYDLDREVVLNEILKILK